MKSIRTILLPLSLLMAISAGAVAGTSADAVDVSGAYARAVPPGQPNSASFMTLTNRSDQPLSLVGAKSPAAKVVELHTHTMEQGMMRMRQVDKITVPASGEAKLQPGGDHVMLMGLLQDLQPGTDITVTLVFADGSVKEILAPVQKIRMKMMKHDGSHSMH